MPTRLSVRRMALVCAAVLLAVCSPSSAETYEENFTNTTYFDGSSSTALWDTSLERISLHPFEIARVGTTATAGNAQTVARHGDYVFVCESGDGVRS